MNANYQSIMKELRSGHYAPVYLFEGEEDYFIDQLTNFIEDNALDEAEKAFDQVVLYGRDVNELTILDEIKRFPMIGNRRLVIVKEAQNLKNPEILLPYIQNPLKHNILVLAYKHKKMDGKKAVTKYLRQHHVHFESARMYDNQIAGWIEDHVKSTGRHITPDAAALLAEYVGAELSRLHKELEKLMLIIPQSVNITSSDIEKNIGISKEFNNFELVNALALKDVMKANKIINYFAKNPKNNSPIATTTILYNFFSKLLIAHGSSDKTPKGLGIKLKINPYFTKDYIAALKNYPLQKNARIIGYLREFDMKLKGKDNVSTNELDLMRDLIFKILH